MLIAEKKTDLCHITLSLCKDGRLLYSVEHLNNPGGGGVTLIQIPELSRILHEKGLKVLDRETKRPTS